MTTESAAGLDPPDAMIGKGQLVSAAEFQRLMGWHAPQDVSDAVGDGRLFYVEHHGGRYFPAFYANLKYPRLALEAVTRILGKLPSGSKLQFFLTRKGSLGGATPLEALAAGDVAKVENAAAAFAEVG